MFADLNLDFSFIEGYDAFDLSEREIWKIQKSSMDIGGQPLNPGEIACAMGHKKIYEKIIENNIPFALVCEDGIKAGLAFKLVINSFLSLEPKAEVINFMTDARTRVLDPIIDIYSFCEFMEPPNQTSCYLVSLDTAKKLVEFQTPLKYGADTLLGSLSFGGLRSAGVVPSIVALQNVPTAIHDVDFGEKNHSMSVRTKRFLSRLKVVIPDAIRNF